MSSVASFDACQIATAVRSLSTPVDHQAWPEKYLSDERLQTLTIFGQFGKVRHSEIRGRLTKMNADAFFVDYKCTRSAATLKITI
jgi:hypothetical protein